MTNQTPTTSGVSVLKSLAPWICYAIGLGINLANVEGSGLATMILWVAGLVLSIVFLVIDKRNGKNKPEHIVALIAGVTGILIYIVFAVLAVLLVTTLFLDMFRY